MTEPTWKPLGFTLEARFDPDDLFELLTGGQIPRMDARPVQVDVQEPDKIGRLRRFWLWLRRKPVPTHPVRYYFSAATATITLPDEAGEL